ncbi:hypothetical protein ONE63_005806 [Megalurothrips usitatus]|uniref:Uncharacterized protein n=1 Tax=Megalurothrips usitatus TaxID=439358 RepID=A0AAV7Y071_9NEOP|nr:hypothetical protein ONE63_005806 [Megalurothrips usitatus]
MSREAMEMDNVHVKNKRLKPSKKIKLSDPSDFKENMSPTDFLNDVLIPCLEDVTDPTIYDWMLKNNLLKIPQRCGFQDCPSTRFVMVEASESTEDPSWECTQCYHITDIRAGSFFSTTSLSIRDVVRVILAWLEGSPPSNCCRKQGLNLPRSFSSSVLCIYMQCTQIVKCYMEKEGVRPLVYGGSGSVVLVDLWPHPSSQVYLSKRKKQKEEFCPVLWMTDTNRIPPRYFAYLLPPPILKYEILEEPKKKRKSHWTDVEMVDEKYKGHDKSEMWSEDEENLSVSSYIKLKEQRVLKEISMQKNGASKSSKREIRTSEEKLEELSKMREEEIYNAVLPLVLQHVAPNSLIVANDKTIPNICSALRACGKYEAVVPLDNLLSIDDGLKPSRDVLRNIWETASKKCYEIGYKPRPVAAQILDLFMWKQIFGTDISSAALPFFTQIGKFYVSMVSPPT